MDSSSASGGKLAELEEELKGLKEQKAEELKKEKGTRDLELLSELNEDLEQRSLPCLLVSFTSSSQLLAGF